MHRTNLVLIHRGPEYANDFQYICKRVVALDSSIKTFFCSYNTPAQIASDEWNRPTLTVSLSSVTSLVVKRGTILASRFIDKIEQVSIFIEHGISTPYAEVFKFGMKIDPERFGTHVIIKPLDARYQSRGHGIMVFRRSRLEVLNEDYFSPQHLIRTNCNSYVVQKFVDTGRYASTYRVLTFLGQAMYCIKVQATRPSPSMDRPDDELEIGDYTQKIDWNIELCAPHDVLKLAGEVAHTLSDVPTLGIDIIREEANGKLYVLEVNAGGNTWHFSSSFWAENRRKHPDIAKGIRTQFGAFDRAASVLVAVTNKLAR